MRGGWGLDGEGRMVDLKLLYRLLPFVRPHFKAFGVGWLLLILSAVAKLAAPYIIKLAIDGPMARGEVGLLFVYGGVYLLFTGLESVLDACQTIIIRLRGQTILKEMRTALFAKTQRLPTNYYDRTPSGQTLSRITSDVSVLSDLFSAGLLNLVGDILLLIAILIALFRLDPELATVTYMVLPIMALVSEVFRRKMREAYRATRKKTAELTGMLQEFLSGFHVVRVFGVKEWAEKVFGRANDDHRDAFLKSVNLFALFFPLVELASSMTLALVLWKGGEGVLGGALSLGTLVAFFEYLQRFFRPLRDLSEKYNVLQASMAAIERITQFLDLDEAEPRGTGETWLSGAISFRDVEFSYDKGTPVIRKLNLEVAPGETVAVVGPTGGGKSTMINLLADFYRPDRGAVLADGLPVGDYSPDSFYRQVALVPQDVFLFDDTVAENIRLGRDWITDKEVRRAAEAVGLGETVDAMAEGYGTRVREGGSLLSAGQRQLVAFARALAGDPSILLLDEATSEVDQATEQTIEEALNTLFAGRTSLVVAHRLATVKRADRVAVVSKGCIAEEGTHDELMENSGIYRTLYELQFRDENLGLRLNEPVNEQDG